LIVAPELNQMQIYQFIPLASLSVMRRLIGQAHTGTVPVLDLEDGLIDIHDPSLTKDRRRACRDHLIQLCGESIPAAHCKPLALRINPYGTADFLEDLLVARVLADCFGIQSILLAKTSSAQDLVAAQKVFCAEGIACGSIIPMIETKTALEDVDQIAAKASEIGSTCVIYGHHDYCLDAKIWPFPAPDDPSYWLPVQAVAKAALARDVRYLHPPIGTLQDCSQLGLLLIGLKAICGEYFDVFSSGISQTPILRRMHDALSDLDQSDHQSSYDLALDAASKPLRAGLSKPSDPKRLAEEVVKTFMVNHRVRHSFAADSRKDRFISPHEYLAALNYLEYVGCE